MEFHPIANVFPLIEGEDFKRLVANIKANGLLEPITTHEGKILDGRNRYRACMEAGVAVRSQSWDGEGGTPAQFVWSKNAERRQLNPSQKALAAQAIMPYLEAEAKERQRLSPGRPTEKGSPNSDYLSGQPLHHAGNVLAAQNPKAPKVPRAPTPVAPAAPAITEDDEHAAALRRSRSKLALVSPPPAEDASDAAKTLYASRPARVFVDWLGGLRRDFTTQQLAITPETLEAWWAGVESREWEQAQEYAAWFEQTCAAMLKLVRYKAARHSVPPMVERINRQQSKRHA